MNKEESFDKSSHFRIVETDDQLERFYYCNRFCRWMAFDTEFIPEKYYRSKLCIISIASPRGNYVIDTLKLRRLDGFLKLLESPDILKITHAGENDYQILVSDYYAKPKNLFDTQMAYGFLNCDYPLGLQSLVEKELRVRMNKAELRSDWEKRPLTHEQLRYAISDVKHLYPLMKVLEERLKKSRKLSWALEECKRWEDSEYFSAGPSELVDSLGGMLSRNLSYKQRVFLVRLHRWREVEAKKRNCPVNAVLKTQYLNIIIKGITLGKAHLIQDRTIPNFLINNLWPIFEELYERKVSTVERELLKQIPRDDTGDPDISIALDMLYMVMKLKAVERGISPNLVISRKELGKMKNDRYYYPSFLDSGWRKELLGESLLEWLRRRNPIDIRFHINTCTLTMADWEEDASGAGLVPQKSVWARGFHVIFGKWYSKLIEKIAESLKVFKPLAKAPALVNQPVLDAPEEPKVSD